MTTPDHNMGRSLTAGTAHTNNERFNAMLNTCPTPRAVYAALWALGTLVAWIGLLGWMGIRKEARP